jgi:hypothetical protein
MLYGNDTPGKPFRDGFLTSRNTFQKYFTQAEFKDYLEHVLARPAFMVGPGVALVFASTEAEQQFSAGRYGFASAGLTKHIAQGIAPRLDQHASCEHSTRRTPVCDRGGAACDFIVDDEDMKEVADWIVGSLPFDRLYYYGPARPIHVSYGPTPAGEAFSMVLSRTGRLMPRPFVTGEAAP